MAHRASAREESLEPIAAGPAGPRPPSGRSEAVDREEIGVGIVDPDVGARQRLRRLLESVGRLAVRFEVASGAEAVRDLGCRRVDLLFLETRLPDLDGFELLEIVRECSASAVVVVMGPAERALRAFEHGALDFLEKPVDPGQLLRSLARARIRLDAERTIELSRHLLAALEHRELQVAARPRRLLLRVAADRQRIFEPDDICWIDAAGNYVWVNCAGDRHRVREGIGAIEELLDREKFLRIHRSTIVNVDCILEVRSRKYGDCMLVLENGKRFNVGRTYKERVLELLGIDDSPLQPVGDGGSGNGGTPRSPATSKRVNRTGSTD